MGHRLKRLGLVCVLALACGETEPLGDCPPTPTEAEFRVEVHPERLDLYRGESATLQVWALERDVCAAEVQLSIRGLPPGVSAEAKTITADRTSAFLEIHAQADAEWTVTDLEIDVRSPSSFRTHLLPFSVRRTGLPVEGFGDGGLVEIEETDRLIDVALDETGRIYLLLETSEALNHVRLIRLHANGTVDESFLPPVLPSRTFTYGKGWYFQIHEVGKRLFVVGRRDQGLVIHAVGESGSLDSGFGSSGELVLDWFSRPLDVRIHGDALIIGGVHGREFFHVEVDGAGMVSTTLSGERQGRLPDMALVQDSGLVLGNTRYSELHRYGPDGSRPMPSRDDMEYVSLAPGANGEIYGCGSLIISGAPDRTLPVIEKWHSDGSPDPKFGMYEDGLSDRFEPRFDRCVELAPSHGGIIMHVLGGVQKLVRFYINGRRDLRFGDEGTIRLPYSGLASMSYSDEAGLVVAQQYRGILQITRLHP